MKKHVFVLIISLGIAGFALSQDFYEINTINTIEIIFTQSNWDEILDSLFAAMDEERLVGTAVINGVVYDSVGVRYKGFSSYNPDRTKNPLNIKLDYIIEDQKLDGYGTIKLANVFKDPSFVRETLGYEIARKYMPASRANYANVYINGTHLGLYTNVQSVDKHFLASNFNSNNNVFLKGELELFQDPLQLQTVWGYLGTDSTSYYDYYELKSDYGWCELINFLDTLNNFTNYVEEVLNVDRHLWMLAYDILLVNLDAPVNFAHNFYLYRDNTSRFNPIIWDLNENFGSFNILLTQGLPPLSTIQMQQLDPVLNSTSPYFPLISNILSDSTYRKIYITHMKTMIEENFSNGWYETRALEIQNIINADVQADMNKFHTYDNFLENINNTVSGDGPPGPENQPVVGLTELMDTRVSFLSNLAEFQYAAPEISNISYTPVNLTPNSTIWINAELSNENSVILAYRYHPIERFEKITMYDDGNHNDGAPNDGLYGVSISIGMSAIQYYIYAANYNAVSFSPERAENEFYTLTVSGDLVINEFMALNETTVTDLAGEYDDWIELYNNSDGVITLTGYYLSDDSSDPVKWTFPDTSIAPNDYLIIWADNDEDQPGLHSNFKLSASGEEIVLCNDSNNILNQVAYGTQQSDISTGRYPNGTGNFIFMTPTVGTENLSGIVSIGNEPIPTPSQFSLYQNYPNPFNPVTTIVFSLSEANDVTLEVFNVRGQHVQSLIGGHLAAGEHQYRWQSVNLPTGLYFYRLTVGSISETKKMMLLK